MRSSRTASFAAVAAAFYASLFWTRSAAAQVNIESVRSQLDTSTFGARLRLSFSAYAGNTEGVIMGTSGIVGGRIGPNLGFATASADYARLGGSTSVKKSFAHLRHNYELTDFFWWEEFVQSETDRFRRIQIRALLGTGPRFALFETHKWLSLYVGLAYMLEYTSIDPTAVILEPALVHRSSSYVALTMRPDDRIVFTTVSYYQPRFDEWTDTHFLNVSSVEFKVTPLLSSRIDATTRYESVVPLGVKRADLEFKSSLELKF
ncbi:MAG TPA: DUF481 domain-containing protein [Polyangiaceae bacterium]|nr:DUF481 domain-containing protein [Polyangiaceae bacterium]